MTRPLVRSLHRARMLGVTLAVLAGARGAAAEEALVDVPTATPADAVFGDRGELIVTADRLFSLVSYTTQSITAMQGDTEAKVTDSGVAIALLVGREPTLGAVHTVPRVAVDFTVARHVTLGTSVAFAFGVGGDHVEERTPAVGPRTTRESRAPRSTMIGFAPRVGYVVALGRRFAFWPRAGFGFASVTSKTEETSNLGVTSTTRVTDTLFSLDLDPQLVWLPIPHVLVHAGPLVNVPLNGAHATSFSQAADAKERTDDLTLFHLGLSVGLGAWFDL